MNVKVGDTIRVTRTKPGYKYYSVGDIGTVTMVDSEDALVLFLDGVEWLVGKSCSSEFEVVDDEILYNELVEKVRKVDEAAAKYLEEYSGDMGEFEEEFTLYSIFHFKGPQGEKYWRDIARKIGEFVQITFEEKLVADLKALGYTAEVVDSGDEFSATLKISA